MFSSGNGYWQMGAAAGLPTSTVAPALPRLPKPTFALDLAAAVNVLSQGKQGDASSSALISQPLRRVHETWNMENEWKRAL